MQHHTMHLTGNKTDEHRRSIRWNTLKNHALTCKIHEKPHSIPLKRRKTGKNDHKPTKEGYNYLKYF
ncbi:MAG: hypothetical protein PF541_10785 [Prolixibacteraceae bacterium]|nr:hypothetical protein [Prolixibacteraceae bacterium]